MPVAANPHPAASPAPSTRMDWEAFFRRYREPDFIPGFSILNKLGSGVFGEVYKAKKVSIGKFYAIKFLKVHDETLTEQVVRELGAIDQFAEVDHPNLVSIEDRGEACGIPYIVMGYAGDETLKTLLQGGALPRTRAIGLFRQMLAGVQALHERSIIHFDLKPANVFIRGEVARVGDYGLSRLMSESRATLSMGRGTPYYMAPEMLQRRGDARSDVYSLGVILFEMLVGRVPFTGETEWEILKRHESEALALPPGIPAGLGSFITTALQKSPDARFTNAGAAARAFEVAVHSSAGDEVQVAPIVAGSTVPRGGKRRRTPAEVGAAVGRAAARGRVTLEKVRGEVKEVLHRVRENGREARQAFEAALAEGRVNDGAPSSPRLPFRTPRLPSLGIRRRLRPGPVRSLIVAISALVHAALVLVAWPFRLAGYILRNAFSVVAALAVVAVACVFVHLGLQALIL